MASLSEEELLCPEEEEEEEASGRLLSIKHWHRCTNRVISPPSLSDTGLASLQMSRGRVVFFGFWEESGLSSSRLVGWLLHTLTTTTSCCRGFQLRGTEASGPGLASAASVASLLRQRRGQAEGPPASR